MDFLILGPIEVHSAAGVVALGGGKPRAVLAVLLLHANRPVSAERLALALWGEDAPGGAVKTVQVHVSRLRKSLGDADVIATSPAGYCLRVRDGELDAARFERLVEDARGALAGGQPADASAMLREAIALWRGQALADLAMEPFARAESTRLEEQRLAAIELRVEADLAAGRHAEVVGELAQLVADHPTREQLSGQLMLALYRCGRQSDALEVYASARRVLVDEMGIEPGPELRDLHAAILRQDVALQADTAADELPAALDPSASQPLVGRADELAWLRARCDSARTGAGGVVALIGPRGAGKTRLTQELAREVHGDGMAVVYGSGAGPADTILVALGRVRAATRPVLLVLDDADRAGAGVRTELAGLDLRSAPVLVIACGQDGLALTHVEAADTLELRALGAEAVRAIAARYAPGRPAAEVPAEWLLDASGGVARRVHEVAGQWARREAARHVGAVADRVVAGRAELRSIEAELTGGVVDLQETRERSRPRGDDATPVVCPFKGLASYDVADARYFFGRERLVAELVARLVGAPLLGVVGPSGSGKSSVMRAGLLPALAGGVLPGSEDWAQALLRPGAHPLRELGVALAGVPPSGRVVLAVDQFEEAFTVCDDEEERAEFISELVHAATGADGRYLVVLALRADHYGRCAAYPELARLLATSNVLVHPMLHDELLRAIERPAQVAGLRIEAELVDELVADVEREPGGLPLMSTALLELWQRRDGRRLRHAVYAQMGGVHGAVARLAEQAYGELDDGQRTIARDVLMRLVDAGDGDGIERRRVTLDELDIEREENRARVVALLTDRRLLTVSAGTVELAHEALLREWPRLVGWIDEDRDGLRIRRTLRAAAQQWDELGREDAALYRGARLAESAAWREAQQPALNELEGGFLDAGESLRRRERVTRRRRMVLAFGSLAVAVVAISVVAIVSIVGARSTASRELANRSRAVLAGDPGLALSFGLRAVDRRDTPEAETAVRQATYDDRARTIVSASSTALYGSDISADGSRLATAAQDGRVLITDLAAGRVVATIPGPGAAAIDVAFGRQDEQVAIVYADGSVAIAPSRGGPRRVVTRLFSDGMTHARSVEYAPGGQRLLVACNDDKARLVELDGSGSRVLATHEGVRVARMDSGGTRILTAGEDGYARTWDLAGHRLTSLHHGADIFDATWTPDGHRIASVGADGVARIWNARTGSLARKLPLDLQALYSVRFNDRGSRFVTGGADGTVRVTGIEGGPVIATLQRHRDIVFDAGFIHGDDEVFSDGADGTVRTWALSPTHTLAAGPGDAAFGPNFDDGGSLVVSGFILGRVVLWNPATGSRKKLPRFDGYAAAVFSGDGRYILSSSGEEPTVRLYDVEHGTSVKVPATEADNYAATIDSTGRRLALAGAGERVLLEAPDGSRAVRLAEHGVVDWLAFSPDDKHVATASEDGKVRTWNAATGAAERVFTATSAVQHVAYSPDGRRLVAAGTDGSIHVWGLDGGSVVLYGHDGAVNVVAFDSDGDRIVSGGKDGTVRVWDADGGDALVVLHVHVGEVTGAQFSPDGHKVVSGADDGVRITACEVCGSFADVRALAALRPPVALTDAARSLLATPDG